MKTERIDGNADDMTVGRTVFTDAWGNQLSVYDSGAVWLGDERICEGVDGVFGETVPSPFRQRGEPLSAYSTVRLRMENGFEDVLISKALGRPIEIVVTDADAEPIDGSSDTVYTVTGGAN